jgi:tetratricopeptide (TPR) repeat protein
MNREIYLCRARAQISLDKFSDATSTLTLVDKLSNSPNEHMMAIAMLGNAYKGNTQYNEALASYKQSMDLAKSQKNVSFERIIYTLIAEVQLLQKQYDEAIISYQSALKLSLNDNERADIFEHIAHIYNVQEKYILALEYQLKATIAYTHYGDLDNQASAGLELGRLYIKANEMDQAEKSINKIMKLAVDNGGPYWEARSNLAFAELMLAKHLSPDRFIDVAIRINKDLNDSFIADDIDRVRSLASK